MVQACVMESLKMKIKCYKKSSLFKERQRAILNLRIKMFGLFPLFLDFTIHNYDKILLCVACWCRDDAVWRLLGVIILILAGFLLQTESLASLQQRLASEQLQELSWGAIDDTTFNFQWLSWQHLPLKLIGRVIDRSAQYSKGKVQYFVIEFQLSS